MPNFVFWALKNGREDGRKDEIWKFGCRRPIYLEILRISKFSQYCLINTLITRLQPPPNFILNWNYDQFGVLSPLCPKYGNSGPGPQYFVKFCTLVNFHNCLINTLPKSPQSPANFVSNSNCFQFIDFAGKKGISWEGEGGVQVFWLFLK